MFFWRGRQSALFKRLGRAVRYISPPQKRAAGRMPLPSRLIHTQRLSGRHFNFFGQYGMLL
ncbi:hypothetical protein CHU92_14485 [Flavobacterium cyanobacteriorum]|uniref:Uncharacterized protein n=1 Tax=Flavobacterium cyanobacteriorum TaxID=2022802 RepID=A0A255YSA6_9FLAO|nr:hypothetical protein CHU92_14485 [Flavobacterium cyanobacteriorum]